MLTWLVEDAADEHPTRIEEWRSYLDLLNSHAENGIVLPAFDELIWDVFRPIVDPQES
ncbi:unannotated protein [freshwater metagenome]|uniref:Unannotated protein n=1 Tax=freshwater metagenome TaxID=449393 RepID=A0A6J6NNY9_9ZZZZ